MSAKKFFEKKCRHSFFNASASEYIEWLEEYARECLEKEWISVKDELPPTHELTEDSEWCLVSYGLHIKPEYKAVRYNSDSKNWTTYWQEEIKHVTHWQYCEPPKSQTT